MELAEKGGMNGSLSIASTTLEQGISCNRCLEWTNSVETVLEVLNNDASACEGCGRQREMRVVADQYRKRRSRWWIVGTKVVVPIWIVETLRTRKPR
jgi:hypothetical protein